MTIEAIHSDKAPKAVGPYSQATSIGDLVFCSGQVPIDPSTGEIVSGGIEAQTKQVMVNLENVLAAAGLNFTHVVKTTIFLQDMANFSKVNQVYAEFFKVPYPARATIEVAKLPLGADVEIELIASRK